ncbi:MAG: dTDP-4-dehydrorhamnose reductase [Candidatus Dormibacteria bacterium]
MRILITGGRGQLGRELADAAQAAGHHVESAGHDDCNIADPDAVARAIAAAEPEVIVNCAGWTRVDAAEDNLDGAYLSNAIGPRVLAAACARRRLLLVQISTDYVFDGTARAPIDEWQPPAPRSAYGITKLAGESEVRTIASRHQVIRTSWLYGRDGPNFVLTMLRAAAAGRQIRVVGDQVGGPTWTGHLAPRVLRLIERDLPGTFHVTNSGVTSWQGFATAIFAAAGIDADVVPIATAEYPTPAPRPAYSVLDNRACRLLGEPPMPRWEDGLHGYIAELRVRGVITQSGGA